MTDGKETLNNTQETTEERSSVVMPPRRHSVPRERGKFFWLRNTLNIIFIIGAIVGMLVYFFKNNEAGTVIVLGAMAFKMCECVIRLIK